jgi:hypothetical protein
MIFHHMMKFRRVRFTHQNSAGCNKLQLRQSSYMVRDVFAQTSYIASHNSAIRGRLRLHQHSHVVRGTHPTKPNWRILQMTLLFFLCICAEFHTVSVSLWLNLFQAVTL